MNSVPIMQSGGCTRVLNRSLYTIASGEIAVNGGNAAKQLNMEIGSELVLRK